MMSKSSLTKALSFVSLLGFLAACSSPGDQEAEQKAMEIAQSRSVELSEVSNGQCLDLQKYFDLLQGMPGDTRVRKVTTDFVVKNIKNQLTRNFYLSLVAGSFLIEDGNIHELPDLMRVQQTGCESIMYAAEGHSEVYKVTEAKPDSITFENEWGGSTQVTWKSPTSLEMQTVSIVNEDLCRSAKARTIADHTISWGDDGIFAATLGEKEIDPSYLALVTEAKGFALNSLYSNLTPPVFSPRPLPEFPIQPEEPIQPEQPVTEGPTNPEIPGDGIGFFESEIQPVAPGDDRRLVISRLKDLQSATIRPDLTQCF